MKDYPDCIIHQRLKLRDSCARKREIFFETLLKTFLSQSGILKLDIFKGICIYIDANYKSTNYKLPSKVYFQAKVINETKIVKTKMKSFHTHLDRYLQYFFRNRANAIA